MHGRVVHLSLSLGDLDGERQWPGPYLLSKCVRGIVRTFKGCCRKFKALYALFASLFGQRQNTAVQGGQKIGDVETAMQRQETVELSERGADPRVRAKEVEDNYRASLREMFGDTIFVKLIMLAINEWKMKRFDSHFMTL